MGSPFRIWVSCSYGIGSKGKSTVLVREFLIRRYMAKVQYFSNRHAFSISNILIPVLSIISDGFPGRGEEQGSPVNGGRSGNPGSLGVPELRTGLPFRGGWGFGKPF